MAKELTCREKRCEDCVCLISKNGVMCCDELWGRPCDDIGADECPEEVTMEEVEEIHEKTKNTKVDVGAKGEKKKRKAPERKPDEEKIEIIRQLAEFLANSMENVEIANKSKIITFKMGESNYKLDLIRVRPPKK